MSSVLREISNLKVQIHQVTHRPKKKLPQNVIVEFTVKPDKRTCPKTPSTPQITRTSLRSATRAKVPADQPSSNPKNVPALASATSPTPISPIISNSLDEVAHENGLFNDSFPSIHSFDSPAPANQPNTQISTPGFLFRNI